MAPQKKLHPSGNGKLDAAVQLMRVQDVLKDAKKVLGDATNTLKDPSRCSNKNKRKAASDL